MGTVGNSKFDRTNVRICKSRTSFLPYIIYKYIAYGGRNIRRNENARGFRGKNLWQLFENRRETFALFRKSEIFGKFSLAREKSTPCCGNKISEKSVENADFFDFYPQKRILGNCGK